MTWCPQNDSQTRTDQLTLRKSEFGETTRVRVWPALWALVPFVPGAMYVVAYLAGREVAIMGPFAGMAAIYGLFRLITRVGKWLGATEMEYRRHRNEERIH